MSTEHGFDFRMHSFLYRMREGTCAHCGLTGVPVEVVTLSDGERRVIFADGSVCYSDAKLMFLTWHDGTWEMRQAEDAL